MNRISAFIAAAAIVVFFLWPHQARATVCAGEAKVRSDVAAWNSGATVARMEGEELRSFMASFNALTPKTSHVADFALVVDRKNAIAVILVLFKEGCAAWTFTIPRGTYRDLINSI